MGDATGQLAWCRESGISKQVQAFRGGISRMLLSPDGRLLAVLGVDGQLILRMYDAVNGALIRDIPVESGVKAMGFSGDGRSLLVQDTATPCTTCRAVRCCTITRSVPARPPNSRGRGQNSS